MISFVFGGLVVCVLFFLSMIAVTLISIERKIKNVLEVTEEQVMKLYKGG